MMWVLVLLACAGSGPVEEQQPVEPETNSAPPPAEQSDTLSTSAGAVTFAPIVHATMRIDAAGKTVWVDPWTKGELDGPKADVILVTDVHPDHLDPAAIEAVRKPETVFVAPRAVVDELAKANLADLDVRPLANGERTSAAGLSIEAVPMYNLERGPASGGVFHEKGRGNGYLLEIGDGRVYIAGDTECTPEMRAMSDVDVAFVPMNLPYTMPPAEAAACIREFAPKVVYPYHYGEANLDELDEALKGSDVVVRRRNWYPNGMPF